MHIAIIEIITIVATELITFNVTIGSLNTTIFAMDNFLRGFYHC